MKKVLLTLVIIFSLSGITNLLAQPYIYVAIAKDAAYNKYTDFDYFYDVAYDYNGKNQVQNTLRSTCQSRYPGCKTQIVSNYSGGNYLVIISTSYYDLGDKVTRYGVGFGSDASDAERDAIRHLKGRTGNWSDAKHGHSVVLSKYFN